MSDEKKKVRSFRVVHVAFHTPKKSTKHLPLSGKFTGAPVAAAKKAARKACKDLNIKKGACTLEVYVKEITRGSKKKVYAYTIERIANEHPVEIVRGDRTILHHFKLHAKSIPSSHRVEL